MIIGKRKGGQYESEIAAQNKVSEMRTYLDPSGTGCQNVSEMQDSVFRSAAILVLCLLIAIGPSYAETITEASYYTVASCMKESGQAIMANGRALDDNKTTAASWDYDFGTRLRLRNMSAGPGFGRTVTVVVTDRGPAKRLYKKGRKIDLSLAAFRALCPDVKRGIITVEITKLGGSK